MRVFRGLFFTLATAVQLITFVYVMVLLSNSGEITDGASLINTTDAQIVFYLAAFAALLTIIEGGLLWSMFRGPRQWRRRNGADAGRGG